LPLATSPFEKQSTEIKINSACPGDVRDFT
jgi:hypothetical protein